MIKRALLFPSSNYLSAHWWHRLATVVFWAWLGAIAIFLLKALVLDPYSSCVSVKYLPADGPSDLDCGAKALDYALTNAAHESFPGVLLATSIVLVFSYAAALLPSLVYRVLLFIGKGNSWRDPASAA